MVNRDEVFEEYWLWESKLRHISRGLGLTTERLTRELASQPPEIVNEVRPILQRQVKLLKLVWPHLNLDNVICVDFKRRKVKK